jgi:RHH-type proline utilization regulon transcriptional repressor/proline dehydrogenase/delta 1-pyrroline-5-carboxylate dehydrogenase
LPAECDSGSFVSPAIIEIASITELKREVFGPVLHVLRYRREHLAHLVADINATGYGLTLGIHSRIDETIDAIVSQAKVGNIYVNRNMVGAVVGVQPFGGEGKSGTGPKAGGPLYLRRLRHAGSGTPCEPLAAATVTGVCIDKAAEALSDWARARGDLQLAERCAHYRQTSLCGTNIALPGPTGESNRLHFAARGTILCAANDASSLLNQLAAVLATGNDVAVPESDAALLPQDLPDQVKKRVRLVNEIATSGDIALALLDATRAARLLPLLIKREGALVPTIITAGSEPVPHWRLVAERAVCINTTAAGGNASLMSLAAG